MKSSKEAKILIGHNKQWKEFIASFNAGKLHHAWLLVGERGVGKATFAYQATKFLMKNKCINTDISSNNHDIERKIEKLSHPDLYILDEQSVDEKSASIEVKVDAIRMLQDFLMLTPASSRYKVIIIDDIGLLNLNAANALLKFLEEPTPNTIFLIVCHTQGMVLPTIRSRCRTLKFSKLTFEEFKQAYFSQHSEMKTQDISELYEKSQGSLAYAQLLDSEQAMATFDKVKLALTEKSTSQNVLELAQLANDDETWEVIKYSLLTNLFSTIKKVSIKGDRQTAENNLNLYEKVTHILHNTKKFHLERSAAINTILADLP